jgi:hypothetical protein
MHSCNARRLEASGFSLVSLALEPLLMTLAPVILMSWAFAVSDLERQAARNQYTICVRPAIQSMTAPR